MLLDNEILGMLNPDEYEEEIMSSGDYQMNIEEVIFSITATIEKLASVDDNLSMPDLENVEDKKMIPPKTSVHNESYGNRAKLPKLQLKSFSGDRLKFHEFWECFESAIHSDSNIDKITKYNYLRSLLEDEAAAVISGLSLTSDNYAEAVSPLHDRYANKQVLISAHIDKLLNLSTVISSADTTKLRELYVQIEINVRCLKNLDISSTHYGPILLQITMKKLPNDIQLIVSRAMAAMAKEDYDEIWEIDKLIKAFKCEIESHEMCSFIGTGHENRAIIKYSASSLITGAGNHSTSCFCVYCEKNPPNLEM